MRFKVFFFDKNGIIPNSFIHYLIKYLTICPRLIIILLGYLKDIKYKATFDSRSEGGNSVSQVRIKDNESLDSAIRRFKRQTSRDGIIQEVRKREHYEKPSVARKKKSEAARKRKYK